MSIDIKEGTIVHVTEGQYKGEDGIVIEIDNKPIGLTKPLGASCTVILPYVVPIQYIRCALSTLLYQDKLYLQRKQDEFIWKTKGLFTERRTVKAKAMEDTVAKSTSTLEAIPTVKPASISNSDNNGGTTSYYDLPRPNKFKDFSDERKLLHDWQVPIVIIERVIDSIYKKFPSTLNDLIEYKDMKPWQHEIFKADYALRERAVRATDGSSSILRELNKMKYYIDRGIALEKKGL